jgi:hypothetical protein
MWKNICPCESADADNVTPPLSWASIYSRGHNGRPLPALKHARIGFARVRKGLPLSVLDVE